MSSTKINKIDSVKATLFILLAIMVLVLLLFTLYMPEIRRLKLAVSYNERSLILLQQEMIELQTKKANVSELREANRNALTLLGKQFDPDHAISELKRFFPTIDLATIKITPVENRPILNFIISEYDVSCELKSPDEFYSVLEFFNSYSSVASVSFPISINNNDRNSLNWRFRLNVFRADSVRNQN
ncbi:hypothetical protein AGMMS50229_03950 [Campylobacterota bacterium]|nr:hypothetical protein AGMMS50229_03950 [Campylobacterota bacterium]